MDGVEQLHKVLANEKVADDKLWTGADKAVWFRLVFFSMALLWVFSLLSSRLP
jgi:hypothetical protein